jgi:hypothetical protein
MVTKLGASVGSATNDAAALADAGSPGTTSDAAARERLEHIFLDLARGFDWDAVVTHLAAYPKALNATPCGRWSALHQAAFATSRAKRLRFRLAFFCDSV